MSDLKLCANCGHAAHEHNTYGLGECYAPMKSHGICQCEEYTEQPAAAASGPRPDLIPTARLVLYLKQTGAGEVGAVTEAAIRQAAERLEELTARVQILEGEKADAQKQAFTSERFRAEDGMAHINSENALRAKLQEAEAALASVIAERDEAKRWLKNCELPHDLACELAADGDEAIEQSGKLQDAYYVWKGIAHAAEAHAAAIRSALQQLETGLRDYAGIGQAPKWWLLKRADDLAALLADRPSSQP